MTANHLTADHDFVIEMAENAIAALVADLVNSLPASIPLQVAEVGPDIIGQVDLLYRWLPEEGVRAETTDTNFYPLGGRFALTFRVYAGSLSLASPTAGRVAPLTGTLVIDPLNIAPINGPLQPPGVAANNPSAFMLVGSNASVPIGIATINLAWDNDVAERIDALLAGVSGFNRAGLTGQIVSAISQALQSVSIPIVPAVTPERPLPNSWGTPTPRFNPRDGSLQSTPPLVIDYELRSVAAANSRPGVLANYIDILFHSFDQALHAESAGGGNLRKTEIATEAGYLGSVTIGPDAFRDLLFLPMLPVALGVVPQGTVLTPLQASRLLPPSLGSAHSAPVPGGFRLTKASIELEEGKIWLTGVVETQGTGYTAYGSFRATLTLSLQQGLIVPNVRVDYVRVSIDLDWWVSFLAALGLGPIGTAIEIAARDYFEEKFSRLGRSTFQNIINSALEPFNLPTNLVMYTPAAIEVHAEGVVIEYSGSLPAINQPPSASLGLSIASTVLGSVNGGTQVDHDVLCTHSDYTYVETLQALRVAIDAQLSNFVNPVQITWTLDGQPLTAGASAQVLTPPYSLGAPEPSVALTATLSADATHLEIVNRLGAADVLVMVQAIAIDSLGQQSIGIRQIPVDGQLRTYGQNYYDDLKRCAQGALQGLPPAGPNGAFGSGDLAGLINPGSLNPGVIDPVPWELAAQNILEAAALRGVQMGWLEQALASGALAQRSYE